ncbi:MAG: bis(5'-nucleosyl)-tetraphosphatase (symmetrical) YqeK [Dehalococcoidia bacterium]|nr:bis(5'-nucleosyl)-tetraphosphatase (symmetrical) YqeK [Dehalococcoidia bacterium]
MDPAAVQRRVDRLPAGLQAHIHRVVEIARELAVCHGINQEQAALAALAHDVARAMTDGELLRRAAGMGLPIGVVDRRVPILLHGPVGAEILQQEAGLTDISIYKAVYWHTTANPDLDELGKVVFIADKLDPAKIDSYPYLPQIRQMAFQDLDRAILHFLTRQAMDRLNRGELVHPVMVETRNALLAASGVPANPTGAVE